MPFIMLLVLILLLLIHFLMFKVDLLSPTIMSIATYILSLSFLILNLENWGITLRSKTIFVVILGILALSMGEITGRSLYRYKPKDLENYKYKFNLIIPQNKITNLIIIYMVFTLIWYYMSIRNTIMISGITGESLLGSYRAADKDHNILLKLFLIVNLSIAYYYLLAFIESYIYLGVKKVKYIVPVVIYFISSIMSSGRIDALYLFSIIVLLSYAVFYQKREWKIKFNTKIINKIFITGVIFLVAFYLLGYLTGKSSRHDFYYIVSLYIGSSIAALDSFLQNFTYSFENFGSETLIGLDNLFTFIGIDSGITNSRFLEFVHLGNMPSRTNIYTSYRRVINDYGYLGMLLYQYLVGLIYSIIYQKIKTKRYINIEFSILLYVYLFRYLIFQFSDERILMNVFTMTTVVQISVFWILLKYFTIRKEVSIREG